MSMPEPQSLTITKSLAACPTPAAQAEFQSAPPGLSDLQRADVPDLERSAGSFAEPRLREGRSALEQLRAS